MLVEGVMGERGQVVGVVATTEEEGAAAIFGACVVLIGKNSWYSGLC